MIICVVYQDKEYPNLDKVEPIEDMYWFEENHVHNLEPQHVNGYGMVRFEFMLEEIEKKGKK